jgi:hypothetical protein
MAQLVINVGAAPNDGLGDPIRTAYQKCNTNFSELYSRQQTTPPATLVGAPGDSPGMYAYSSSYFYYCFAEYDGSSVIWGQTADLGNVSVPQILNGTSNVRISSANANVTVSVDGNTNIAVFSTSGANIKGNLTANANVTGGNISTTGMFNLGTFTTAQIANLTATTGAMVYNTTTGNVQIYTGSGWGNLTIS